MIRLGTCLALAFSASIGFAQTSPGGRPLAPPLTPAEQLRRTLEAQSRQLKSEKATMDRYAKALKEQTAQVEQKKKAADSAAGLARQANQSWNNRRNPTCDSGQTFARCSCRSGAARKRQMAFLVSEAKEASRKATADLNLARSSLDRVATGARQFAQRYGSLIQSFSENLKEYKRRTTKE